MRIHSLTITAFGPFTDTVAIDFDRLSADGLFLLHGPTGAGKTSIIDALTYALYGSVCGVRSESHGLRCDSADPDTPTTVALDVTLAQRRYVITRSPAWDRPKKRGSGYTKQKATVSLQVYDDAGELKLLSTRADEVGQTLLTELGLNRDQFARVVVLPQGEFAAFLHSGEDQRRELLAKLFATERFSYVGDWLGAYADQLRTDIAAEQTAQSELAAMIARRIDTSLTDEQREAIHRDHADEWARGEGAVALLAQDHRAQELALQQARERLLRVRAEHEWLRDIHTATTTLHSFNQQLQSLQARQSEVDQLQQVVERGTAAAMVAAHVGVVRQARLNTQQADADRDHHESAFTTVRTQIQQRLPDLAIDDGDTQAWRTWLQDQRTAADAAQRIASEATTLQEQLTTLTQQLGELHADADVAAQALSAAQERVAKLREQVTQQTNLHTDLERSMALVRDAQAQLLRAQRCESAQQEQEQAHATYDRCADAMVAAVAKLEDARAKRTMSVAATLAAELAPGQGCPVCGGTDHPNLALPVSDTDPTQVADQEQEAVDLVDAANAALMTAREQLTRADTTLAERLELAGGLSTAEATMHLESAQHQHRDILAHIAAHDKAQHDLELAQDHEHACQQHVDTLAVRVAATAARVQETQQRCSTLQQHVHAAHTGYDSLAERTSTMHAALRTCDQYLGAAATAQDRQQACRQAQAELQAALAEHHFDSEEAAVSAVVEPAKLAAARAQVTDHHQSLHTALAGQLASRNQVDSLLAQCLSQHEPTTVNRTTIRRLTDDGDIPAVNALVDQSLPPAASAVQVAEQQVETAVARMDAVSRALGELRDLLAQATELRAKLGPTLDAYTAAQQLADCVRGRGGGNNTGMDLTAFVLAARLEAVAEIASDRLQHMSDGRYTIAHTTAADAGRRKAGLGLTMLDAWTGVPRPPASLSGGETFTTALALALALADVVVAEAGGLAFHTLFIDEGFGTLDPDTLDNVMDILDELRSGGRAVGIISHVPEMRDRITSRVEVIRSRSGSTIQVTAPVI